MWKAEPAAWDFFVEAAKMKLLISLEFYKIVHKKSFYIGLALLFCYCAAVYVSRVDPLGSRYSMQSQDGSAVNGREAADLERELTQQYRGDLTDDAVWRMYCDLMKDQNAGQEGSGQELSQIYPQRVLEHFFLTYTERELVVDGERRTEAAGVSFTKDQLVRIEELFPESVLPLEFGYSVPWSRMLQSLLAGMFALNLFMMIAVSPLFAEEHTQRMNALLFTSKCGRKKCFTAKVTAAFLVGLLLAFGLVLLHVLLTLALFGGEGLSCSIQLTEPFLFQWVSYAKTVGTALVDAICLYTADALLTLSMAVLASVLASNVLTATVYALVLFWIPGFLTGASSQPQILLMFPIGHRTRFHEVLMIPHWNIGFIKIQYSYVIAGVLLMFCALMIWGAWKAYEKMPEEGFVRLTDKNGRSS